MEQLANVILGLGEPAVYLLVGLLAFGEAAAFVGLVLPGELAVLLGGVLAAQGRVSLPVIIVVAAVGAIAGDSAGYEIGRRWGSRLGRGVLLRRHGSTITRVVCYVQRHGAVVVFVGRWTSVLRAVVPAVAGMSRMPYGRFLLFNVLGGAAWAVAFTLAGYAAGESYAAIEAATGRASLLVTAALVFWIAVKIGARRRAHARSAVGDVVVDAAAAEERWECAPTPVTLTDFETAALGGRRRSVAPRTVERVGRP